MSDQRWYRSFYWRIALGFIACVAVLLIAQALFFLWMAERAGMPLLAKSPEHLAPVVASDLSAAIDAEPKLDVQQYIKDRFGKRSPQVVVVMKDGHVFHSGTLAPPDGVVRWARFRLQRGDRLMFGPFPFRPRPRWGLGEPQAPGPGTQAPAPSPSSSDASTPARDSVAPQEGPLRYPSFTAPPFGRPSRSRTAGGERTDAASPASAASPGATPSSSTPSSSTPAGSTPAAAATPTAVSPSGSSSTAAAPSAAAAPQVSGRSPFGPPPAEGMPPPPDDDGPPPGPGPGPEGAAGRDSGSAADRTRADGTPRRSLSGPIVVDGETIGLVLVVPTGVSPFVTLREFGPTLAVAGGILLLIGTATMAFFVFQPARRRLRDLEQAAVQIGAGDTGARAPEEGGDEVTALARTFNRMAAELDARVRELQEVDRARRQLLADVSHELMTPLTAIRGYLETLALPAAVKDEETRERYLQIVTDETLRLEAIIGDLLDLARLEGGGAGATLQREVVPVDALFARAAERHGPMLAERAVTLDTRVDPQADHVAGDGRRLEQAVQNLVANAVRHTPRGGRIGLSSAAVNGHVRLRVQDSGPGIAPEHLSRVFDRFYRVDAARDQASGGSGLGLSIVRAIVEAHGGSVTASAAPEGGAVFDIVLDRPGPGSP